MQRAIHMYTQAVQIDESNQRRIKLDECTKLFRHETIVVEFPTTCNGRKKTDSTLKQQIPRRNEKISTTFGKVLNI